MIEITETLVELALVAQRFNVPIATVQGWLDEGLEHETWNGRVLTSWNALQRFSSGPPQSRSSVERERIRCTTRAPLGPWKICLRHLSAAGKSRR